MAASPATGTSVKSKAIILLFSTLPADERKFVDEATTVAREMVNLPAVFKDHVTSNPEFAGKLTVKKLSTFARTNVFGHFKPMREAVLASLAGSAPLPPWLEALDEMIELPGSHLIDRTLGLVIALRESGGLARPSRAGRIINSFTDGGLDNLYGNRKAYLNAELVPEHWVSEMKQAKGKRTAGEIAQERLMGFYFARVGLARTLLVGAVADEFFSDFGGAGEVEAEVLAEAQVASLTSIERKIWIAIAFAAALGGKNLATVSPGATGLQTILHAFHLADVPLHEIADVPNAESSRARRNFPDVAAFLKPQSPEKRVALQFLRRLPQFFRLNIATKTAIVSQAMDQHFMRAKITGPKTTGP